MVNRTEKLRKYQREWARERRKSHPYIKKGRAKTLSKTHKENIGKAVLGRHKSPETIEKLRLAKKGKPLSLLNRIGISKALKEKGIKPPSRRGIPSPFNKGMAKIQEQIRKCFEYRQWRSDIFQRDEYTCQHCGIKGGKLNADHVKEFAQILEEYLIKTLSEALECEELWNINNGRTLCIPCHRSRKCWDK